MSTLIHTVKSDDNSTITFTLKSNAVNIFEEPKNNLWTFDLEGRLVGMFIDSKNYRRTLQNKFYIKSRTKIDDETFREANEVPKNSVIPLIDKCHKIITYLNNNLSKEYYLPLQNILHYNYDKLQHNANSFNNIYLPISILPPDQYMSLVIQLTEGCNYNQCTFCNFYKDRPFKIKSHNELGLHIDQVKTFFGEGIKLRKSIFLADANAISVPQDRLVNALKSIQNDFPKIKNIYSFVDVFTGIKKSTNNFRVLKENGLKRLYLGVESGNPQLLHFLNKKQSNSEIIELTNIIKKSGINIGIIFLIGAGGKQFTEKHLSDSIELLQKLPLSKGDIVYLSELHSTNSEYIDSMKNMNYELPSKIQIRKWSNEFKSVIKNSILKEIQVSVYDINQFFY